jgi:hypothetical protein
MRASSLKNGPNIIIIAEYSGHMLGFLVESVDAILRLDWSAMRVPPQMISSRVGGLITAVTELADGRLVMMMDVESILAELLEQGRDQRPARKSRARCRRGEPSFSPTIPPSRANRSRSRSIRCESST